MYQHRHVSLSYDTSSRHCNKICRSRIGLLSHMPDHWKTSSLFRGTADDPCLMRLQNSESTYYTGIRRIFLPVFNIWNGIFAVLKAGLFCRDWRS